MKEDDGTAIVNQYSQQSSPLNVPDPEEVTGLGEEAAEQHADDWINYLSIDEVLAEVFALLLRDDAVKQPQQ